MRELDVKDGLEQQTHLYIASRIIFISSMPKARNRDRYVCFI